MFCWMSTKPKIYLRGLNDDYEVAKQKSSHPKDRNYTTDLRLNFPSTIRPIPPGISRIELGSGVAPEF